MAKAKPQRCGTCRYLDVPLNAAGVRRLAAGSAYRCTYPVVLPAMPDSVTKVFGWQPPSTRHMRMEGADGAACPTWEALPAAASCDALPK